MKSFTFFVFFLSSLSFAKGSTNKDAIFEYFECPDSSFLCRTLKINIHNDSKRCLVKPKDINRFEFYRSQEAPSSKSWTTTGRLYYFGPVRGRYLYTLERLSSKKYVLHAKVHFKNKAEFSAQEMSQYLRKFKKAAAIWTKNNTFNNNITFKFSIAEHVDTRTISVRLIRPYTRGPYFSKWSLNWTVTTIAHEFGHIMGLRDEYEYLDDKDYTNNCSGESLMCNSFRGLPEEHHYFLIFQRPFCEV